MDYEMIELLFFAYREFVGVADQELERIGFGRAHHRVLYFVDRRPGLTVAELLEILSITKQSLARVLKQLVDDGYIVQEPGPLDRRQRLLSTTPEGHELVVRLSANQSGRIEQALDQCPSETRRFAADFLRHMVTSGSQASGLIDPE